MNRNIRKLAYMILASFVLISFYIGLLPVYLSHIESKSRRGEAVWPADPRTLERWQEVIAGNIYDKNGKLLAQTITGQGRNFRSYPFGGNFAHVIGYSSSRYGLAGLEANMAGVLTGEGSLSSLRDFLAKITGKKPEGNSLQLTLDASLQEKAMKLLEGKRGALVAMEPKTGKILALASSPTFEPNKIDADMVSLREDDSSPLLNRATQGFYAPGSVFKLITLAAVLKEDPGVTSNTFECPGYLKVEGFKLTDNRVHGKIDLKKAFALSCNTAFGFLGLKIGAHALVDMAKAFGFNKSPDFPIDYYPGKIPGAPSMSKSELASTAIGQGNVVANPMQMALAASAVANEGTIMRPRLIEKIMSSEGKTIKEIRPEKWLTPIDRKTARIMRDYMAEVVRSGTGVQASVPGIQVAGKTGTAENAGKDHAWFVGFAPFSNPRVVVAVIIENGGSGGEVAAPIAREIIRQVIYG